MKWWLGWGRSEGSRWSPGDQNRKAAARHGRWELLLEKLAGGVWCSAPIKILLPLDCLHWNLGHPDNKNQSDGRAETIDSNPAYQIPCFQIQPIKWLVQNNEISTCLLWCLQDYSVAYKAQTLSNFACMNWIICCTFYGVAGWFRKDMKRKGV